MEAGFNEIQYDLPYWRDAVNKLLSGELRMEQIHRFSGHADSWYSDPCSHLDETIDRDLESHCPKDYILMREGVSFSQAWKAAYELSTEHKKINTPQMIRIAKRMKRCLIKITHRERELFLKSKLNTI